MSQISCQRTGDRGVVAIIAAVVALVLIARPTPAGEFLAASLTYDSRDYATLGAVASTDVTPWLGLWALADWHEGRGGFAEPRVRLGELGETWFEAEMNRFPRGGTTTRLGLVRRVGPLDLRVFPFQVDGGAQASAEVVLTRGRLTYVGWLDLDLSPSASPELVSEHAFLFRLGGETAAVAELRWNGHEQRPLGAAVGLVWRLR